MTRATCLANVHNMAQKQMNLFPWSLHDDDDGNIHNVRNGAV